MTMIDLDDLRAYLDNKITEQDRALVEAGDREVTDLTRVADCARRQLLAEICKDLEWMGLSGCTPEYPESDDLDEHADPNIDELDDGFEPFDKDAQVTCELRQFELDHPGPELT